MTSLKTLALVPVSALLLSGCVSSPEAYETEPVEIKTAKGTVTCQLYTDEIVLWDRAIVWPRNFTHREADAVCKEEGRRRAREANS